MNSINLPFRGRTYASLVILVGALTFSLQSLGQSSSLVIVSPTAISLRSNCGYNPVLHSSH